ncbi:MAG: cytochrome c/FTR1 family iron permease [Pseudomonadota bacterium]
MLRPILLAAALLFGLMSAASAAEPSGVQTAWRLLDYLAVDYGGAVRHGKVTSAAEYAEMSEFSTSVAEKIAALPANPAKGKLVIGSEALKMLIIHKSPADEVAAAARKLGADLLAAYPVPLGPQNAPDLARGAVLFQQNCASCHGATGDAQTPMARQLNPPPIAFADRARASQRSPFALYQVINQGIEGTAMQSFAHLPEPDRWALAFQAGRFAYPNTLARQGKRIWDRDPDIRSKVSDLGALSSLSEKQMETEVGGNKAGAVLAYLRANPGAVVANSSNVGIARERLKESLAAYRAGNREEAERLALSAYLDGFEPVETVLATRDGALLRQVETAMAAIRSGIARGEPETALRQRVDAADDLLDRAETALAPGAASDASTFLGAFAILLREGLEALLVVIAMIAFLRKAKRTEALPYVHGGWIGALLAGGATWAIATYALELSGAGRELTEGFGSLLAAVILLSVGIWMHGKSRAEEWRRYIATKMEGALSRGSAWFLFGLAFIVVYREVFETILFYAALWTADNGVTILAGALSAIALLGLIAWAMLSYSRKLPVTLFFKYSAILIAVLAVVLSGKGVGALQEAGIVPVTLLAGFPRITILGLFPTAEAIGAQLLALAAVILGFRSTRRGHAHPLPAE